jgi:hypothetical protein
MDRSAGKGPAIAVLPKNFSPGGKKLEGVKLPENLRSTVASFRELCDDSLILSGAQ